MYTEIKPKITPADNYDDGNGEGQIIIIGGDDTEEYYVTISLYDGASSNSITYNNPGIISIGITDGDETLDYTSGTSDYVFLLSSTGRKYWSVLTDNEYYISRNGTKNISSTSTFIVASLIRVYHYVFTINAGNITQSNIILTYPTTGDTLTFNSNQNSMISSSSTSTTIDFYTAYDKVSIGITLAGYISYTSPTINGIFTISGGNIDNTVFTNITLTKVQRPQYQYIFSIKYDDININSSNYDIDVEGNNINNNIFISEETSIDDYSISFKNKIYYDDEISDTEIKIPDKYVININKCVDCGACKNLCPENAIFINDNERYEINNNCLGISCGKCLLGCSEEAIELNNTVNINIDISNFENSNNIKYYIPINVVDKSTGNIVKSISPTYHKIGDDITIDVSKDDTYYKINGTCSVTITEEMVKNLLRNESYIYNKEIDFNDFQIEYKNVNISNKLYITDKNNNTLIYNTHYIIKSGTSDNAVLDPTRIKYNTTFYIQPKDTTLYNKSGNQRVISEDGDIIDFNITLKDAKNNYPADKYCMPWYINNIKVKYELKDKLSSNTKEFERIVDIYLRDNKSCVSNNSKIIIKPGENLDEAKDPVKASQFFIPMQEKIDGKVYKFDIPLYKEVYPAHMFIKQDDSQQVLTLHKYINTYTQLRYRTGNESETNNEIFDNINGEYSIDFHFTENNLNNTESYTDIQSKIFNSNYSNGINTITLNSSQIPYDENNNYVYTGTMLIYPYVENTSDEKYIYRSYLGCKYDININKEKIDLNFNQSEGFIAYNLTNNGEYSYTFYNNQYTFYENGNSSKKNIEGNSLNEYYPNLTVASDLNQGKVLNIKDDSITVKYSLDRNKDSKTITFTYTNTNDFIGISGTFNKKITTYLYPQIIQNDGEFRYSTTNDNKFSYNINVSPNSFIYNGFDKNMIYNNVSTYYIIKYISQKYNYDNTLVVLNNINNYLLDQDLTWKMNITNLNSSNYRYKIFSINDNFSEENNLEQGRANIDTNNKDYIYYQVRNYVNGHNYNYTIKSRNFSYIKQFIPESDLVSYIKLDSSVSLYLPNNNINIYNTNTNNQISDIYYVNKYYDNNTICYKDSTKSINNIHEIADISYNIYMMTKENNKYYINSDDLVGVNNIEIIDRNIQNSPGYDKLHTDLGNNFDNTCCNLTISGFEINGNGIDIEQLIYTKQYNLNTDLQNKKFEWDNQFIITDITSFNNDVNNAAGTNTNISQYIIDNILNENQYNNIIQNGVSGGINNIIFDYVHTYYSTMEYHNNNYPYTYNLGETFIGTLSDFLHNINKHIDEISVLNDTYDVLNNVSECINRNLTNINYKTFDTHPYQNIEVDPIIFNRYNTLLNYNDVSTNYYLFDIRESYNTCFNTSFSNNELPLVNIDTNCYVGYLTNSYSETIFNNSKTNINIIESNLFIFENYTKMTTNNITIGETQMLPTGTKIGYIYNENNVNKFYIYDNNQEINTESNNIISNINSNLGSYYMIEMTNINITYFDKNIISNNNLIYNGTDTYTYWYLTNNDNNVYNYSITKSIKDNYDINFGIYNEYHVISNSDDETTLNNIYDKINENDSSKDHSNINENISKYIYYHLDTIRTIYNDTNSKILNYNIAVSAKNIEYTDYLTSLYNEINYNQVSEVMFSNYTNTTYFSNENELYDAISNNYPNLNKTKNLKIITYWKNNINDYYELVNGYRFLYKAYQYKIMKENQDNYQEQEQKKLENAKDLFYNYWLNKLYINRKSLDGNQFKYTGHTPNINIETNSINTLLSSSYKLKSIRCEDRIIYYFDNNLDLYNELSNDLCIRYYISADTVNNISTNFNNSKIFNGVINDTNFINPSVQNKIDYIYFGLFNGKLFIKNINVSNNSIKYIYKINRIYPDNFINLNINKGNKEINFVFKFNDTVIDTNNNIDTQYKLELLYVINSKNNSSEVRSSLLEAGQYNDISDSYPAVDQHVYIISYRLKLTNKYDESDFIYGKIYNQIFYYNESIYSYSIKEYESPINNLSTENENDIVDVKLLLDYYNNTNHTYFCSFAKNINESGISFSYISKYNNGDKKELNSTFKLDNSYPTYHFKNKINNDNYIDIEIE